jgi:hypothetical protein
MTLRDSTNRLEVKRVISSTRVADNTAQVGQIIDHRDAKSVLYLINIGACADVDVTFATLLEHGDDAALADAATVPDADLLSQTPAVKDGNGALLSAAVAPLTAASFQFDSDNQVRKLGYIGAKRYSRLTITPANNTGNADFGAVCVLGKKNTPVVQGTALSPGTSCCVLKARPSCRAFLFVGGAARRLEAKRISLCTSGNGSSPAPRLSCLAGGAAIAQYAGNNYLEQGTQRLVIGGVLDIVSAGTIKFAGTDRTAQLNAAVAGVAAGIKIAGGETAMGGSNPTGVATGLASITRCVVALKNTAAPTPTMWVTYGATVSTLNIYGWKPTATGNVTAIASGGTETVGWECQGT